MQPSISVRFGETSSSAVVAGVQLQRQLILAAKFQVQGLKLLPVRHKAEAAMPSLHGTGRQC
jgi:hypothetical protein